MTTPFSDKIPRNPVTAISRPMMTNAIQAGIRPSEMKHDQGSRHQQLVCQWIQELSQGRLQAVAPGYRPSRRSVMEAAEKTRAARKAHVLLGNKSSTISTGMEAILKNVKWLGVLKNLSNHPCTVFMA